MVDQEQKETAEKQEVTDMTKTKSTLSAVKWYGDGCDNIEDEARFLQFEFHSS